jgi:hypothetical protein
VKIKPIRDTGGKGGLAQYKYENVVMPLDLQFMSDNLNAVSRSICDRRYDTNLNNISY